MRFVVWHNGDASVGIPSERATVEVDVESYAVEVRGDYLEQVRDALKRTFSGLWDTAAHVRTELELTEESLP